MAKDFLAEFFESPARARTLRLFVLNEGDAFSAADISKRLRITRRAAEKEVAFLSGLNVIERIRPEGGLKRVARTSARGKKPEVFYAFNPAFRFRTVLGVFVHEVSPIENQNVLGALKGAGRLSVVILSGSFVGDPTRPADLLIAGEALNERRIDRAVRILEPAIGREIRYAAFSTPEFRYRLTVQDRLIRDTLDYPHRILLNKGLI